MDSRNPEYDEAPGVPDSWAGWLARPFWRFTRWIYHRHPSVYDHHVQMLHGRNIELEHRALAAEQARRDAENEAWRLRERIAELEAIERAHEEIKQMLRNRMRRKRRGRPTPERPPDDLIPPLDDDAD